MALLTFIDNVQNLVIENCVLNSLENIFPSSVINDTDESQIEDLARSLCLCRLTGICNRKNSNSLCACSQRSIRVISRHRFGETDSDEMPREVDVNDSTASNQVGQATTLFDRSAVLFRSASPSPSGSPV